MLLEMVSLEEVRPLHHDPPVLGGPTAVTSLTVVPGLQGNACGKPGGVHLPGRTRGGRGRRRPPPSGFRTLLCLVRRAVVVCPNATVTRDRLFTVGLAHRGQCYLLE